MKKIFLAAVILVFAFRASANDPNEKVLSAFHKAFPYVQDVVWSETGQSYEVKFKQNEIISRITYDREGNIIRTLRYYHEQQLPILVLSKLKSKFPDTKVFGVTEESSEEGTFYYVVLENEKHWINITADNYGTITGRKKFNKA